MLYPLTMFCCGCSVPVGAVIIMMCHFAANVAFVACACLNLIAHHASFASTWSVHVQLLCVVFALSGLPVIAGGLWGVAQRAELNVRLYLYYLMLSVVVDTGGLVRFLVFGDVCANDGTFFDLMASNFGEAFLCGATRTFSYLAVVVALTLQAYSVWAVWSLCEDVREGAGGPELSDLIPSKDALFQKVRHYQEGPYGDNIVGFSRSDLPGAYGTINVEGGNSIFGGARQEAF